MNNYEFLEKLGFTHSLHLDSYSLFNATCIAVSLRDLDRISLDELKELIIQRLKHLNAIMNDKLPDDIQRVIEGKSLKDKLPTKEDLCGK